MLADGMRQQRAWLPDASTAHFIITGCDPHKAVKLGPWLLCSMAQHALRPLAKTWASLAQHAVAQHDWSLYVLCLAHVQGGCDTSDELYELVAPVVQACLQQGAPHLRGHRYDFLADLAIAASYDLARRCTVHGLQLAQAGLSSTRTALATMDVLSSAIYPEQHKARHAEDLVAAALGSADTGDSSDSDSGHDPASATDDDGDDDGDGEDVISAGQAQAERAAAAAAATGKASAGAHDMYSTTELTQIWAKMLSHSSSLSIPADKAGDAKEAYDALKETIQSELDGLVASRAAACGPVVPGATAVELQVPSEQPPHEVQDDSGCWPHGWSAWMQALQAQCTAALGTRRLQVHGVALNAMLHAARVLGQPHATPAASSQRADASTPAASSAAASTDPPLFVWPVHACVADTSPAQQALLRQLPRQTLVHGGAQLSINTAAMQPRRAAGSPAQAHPGLAKQAAAWVAQGQPGHPASFQSLSALIREGFDLVSHRRKPSSASQKQAHASAQQRRSVERALVDTAIAVGQEHCRKHKIRGMKRRHVLVVLRREARASAGQVPEAVLDLIAAGAEPIARQLYANITLAASPQDGSQPVSNKLWCGPSAAADLPATRARTSQGSTGSGRTGRSGDLQNRHSAPHGLLSTSRVARACVSEPAIEHLVLKAARGLESSTSEADNRASPASQAVPGALRAASLGHGPWPAYGFVGSADRSALSMVLPLFPYHAREVLAAIDRCQFVLAALSMAEQAMRAPDKSQQPTLQPGDPAWDRATGAVLRAAAADVGYNPDSIGGALAQVGLPAPTAGLSRFGM